MESSDPTSDVWLWGKHKTLSLESKEIDKIDEAWEGMACDILMSAALLFIQFNFILYCRYFCVNSEIQLQDKLKYVYPLRIERLIMNGITW